MDTDPKQITEVQIAGQRFRVQEGSFEIGTESMVADIVVYAEDATWVSFIEHGTEQPVAAPLEHLQFVRTGKPKDHLGSEE